MLKRLTWFAGGVVAGAAGVSVATRKVKKTARRTVETLKPTNVAKAATARVKDAVAEGRAAKRDKEAELKAVRGDV